MIWEALTILVRVVEFGLPLTIWVAFAIGTAAWAKEKLIGDEIKG